MVVVNLAVLAWMLITSLREHREIFADPFAWPGFGRGAFAWGNYAEAWQSADFGGAAVNSLVLVTAAALAVVVVAAPAGYALGRGLGRGAASLTLYFALGIGVPVQVIVIPLFVLMERLSLVNSLFGLFLLYVAVSLPFTVFLLTGYFASLPAELEEAAAIDGASRLRTFWTIMLPLARSGLITALTLNAIGLWNEAFLALVFVQSTDKQTLPLALLGFLAKQQYSGADYGVLFAGVAILVLPMLLLYVWLGRRIIEGMTLGAGK
ncbi:MAG: carbohydrate ABC transporter permease [Nonomuraea sp.]|nr:carbohydrate ABC transporter permease [Nonomuraea sp.]NUP68716.1 carbohydrate ABC transporter permease [Nonomuraea sp.]